MKLIIYYTYFLKDIVNQNNEVPYHELVERNRGI